MKWYIGQKVLYCPPDLAKPIETVITGLRNSICKCGGCEIECGAATLHAGPGWRCDRCNTRGIERLGKWRSESAFRPIIDDFVEEVLEKALKEGKEEWNTHTKDLSNSSSR